MSDRVHGHDGAQQQATSWYEHPTEKKPVQQQPSTGGNPLNEEIDLTKDQIDATKQNLIAKAELDILMKKLDALHKMQNGGSLLMNLQACPAGQQYDNEAGQCAVIITNTGTMNISLI